MKNIPPVAVFLIIIAIVMTASVGLTMGANKIFSSFGPARLTAYFDREFSASGNPDATGAPVVTSSPDPNLIQDVNEITPTPRPVSSNSPTPTVKATSTSAPAPTPSATATPTPIPTPVPDPAHCSIPLTYKVDLIASVYFERGFSRQDLTDIVHQSVKEWEDALGKDLFYHDDKAVGNINFTNEGINSNAEGYGSVTYGKQYHNGTVETFRMKVHGFSMFTFLDSGNFPYFGSAPEEEEDFDESLIRRTVLKQLGHAFGLSSLPYDQATKKDSVMIGGGKWGMSSYQPKLTSDDISFAKNFCK